MNKLSKSLLCTVVLLLLTLSPVYPISERQEIEIGRESATKIESRYGLYTSPRELNRIKRIGRAIARISDRPHLPYTFKILNTNAMNALAAPGGFIYTTKGLMKNTTDAELAFVLGHEIAHAAKRHSARQLEKNTLTEAGLTLLSALINKGKVSEGSMNTIQLASKVLSSGYSRSDEFEADRTACHYMVKGARANPRAGISFLKKLKEKGKELPGFLNSIIGDHPMLDSRIEAVEAECVKMGY